LRNDGLFVFFAVLVLLFFVVIVAGLDAAGAEFGVEAVVAVLFIVADIIDGS